MPVYNAPLKDMEFVLKEIAGIETIAKLPDFQDATPDLVQSILHEAAKLANEILAPLNRIGDKEGSHLVNGTVKTPPGWKEAYQQFVDNGWNSLAFDQEYGGQGLPWTVATPLAEMWHGANMAFGLCPMLTQGAIESVSRHGSDFLKQTFLPKMISGAWTGTMTLTEPQAGSDLSAIKAKAVPDGDHYRVSGQKIFITYGDHDLTENIIHMVLARTPDAPEGIKGISLFLVPKFLINADGKLGDRNDVHCVSLEHKMGIHASPTAVMSYGDNKGAIAYLIGEKNYGLMYMFTMMNMARHGVGVEGLAISESAYQTARSYAKERIQGNASDGKTKLAIIEHPDVRRMLMTMKSQIEAMRALAYIWSAMLDTANKHPDKKIREQKQALVDLLTPVVKGWCTELSIELSSLCLQVHGGMGYIEETGAAQLYRDARITTIYEGTTGIQANDLIGRKVLRDQGKAIQLLISEMNESHSLLKAAKNDNKIAIMAEKLSKVMDHIKNATAWILEANKKDPRLPAYASFNYLKLLGTACGGWLMMKSALIATQKLNEKNADTDFLRTKIVTAVFYCEQILPQVDTLVHTITNCTAESGLDLAKENF